MGFKRAGLAAALALACHGAAACEVVPRISVPVTRSAQHFLVPVAVDGVTVSFVLDTGAERTTIAIPAADRLHLRRDEWVSTDSQGAGGRDRRRLGRPDTLTLGGVALRRHTVAADNSVVVGPLPDGVDGLLGQDMLSPYDLDLDVGAGGATPGRLTLFSVSGCAGRFLPWRQAYVAIGAWRPVRNVLAVPLRIGAAALWAELDTGAAQTVLTLPGMIQLGLASGGDDTMHGFGAGSLAARTQHMPAVQVGSLPAAAMDLVIAPVRTLRSLGALLGADWVAGHHLWISWATDQVFVQTQGQPGP